MTTRLEQQRLLAREILGDSLFLVQLNCSRPLREQRTLARGPLPADDSFDPSDSGAHIISTDRISVLQTAQLILKMLRLRQEHPSSAGAPMDKPVLRRILPLDQAEQKLPVPSVAMDQRPAARSNVATTTERTPSVSSGLKNSPANGGGQFHSALQRDEKNQSQPAPPPREAPSRTWRGTMETDATIEPEPGGAEVAAGEQVAGRTGRHRPRRFVENQDLVWSPLSLIILTICTGIAIAVFVWIIDSSLKKKAEKERLMEGNVPSIEPKPKPYETTPPSEALTKKRNANGK
ncbi:MAG: hypothetical protein K8R87_05655 [Verrucomicrobia bacterium]|nr:hypothetical protein [Verrucomicrobiota bacterium]